MADNVKYRFIENIGEYFPSDYFGEDFLAKVQQLAGYGEEQMRELTRPYTALKEQYAQYKNFIVNSQPRPKDAITRTNEFHARLLTLLGYDAEGTGYREKYIVSDDADKMEIVPVRNILRHQSNVTMLVMEMRPLIRIGDHEPAGLFEQQYDDGTQESHQRYTAADWKTVFSFNPETEKISPSVINKAVSRIFLMPEQQRPRYILMLAGNTLMLFQKDKWERGSYLQFSLDELFSQASISAFRNYYALFHLLVCRETLAADTDAPLMNALLEDSFRNAHDVTRELKNGVVQAVETIANEALYYMKHIACKPFGKKKEDGSYDETDDSFEAEVKDDCLTIVYRLLFIFYAESRTELEILPTSDPVYQRGYSLEMLRDLEQVNLQSQQSRDGYFFDDSVKRLFAMLAQGINQQRHDTKAFRVTKIDSPMFDDKRLHHLQDVRLRNQKWQQIIRALSLSQKNGQSGRISYSNLGVNQLGSVYESLLAYRGFYAEEDYIEVHKANTPEDGTFLVPYSRFDNYDISEVLKDRDGNPIILKKGTFVYRLNGRDRQKSASYYTPEVLTRSTIKYTLKSIIDDVAAGKRKATNLLELKILEPAMGAAAFLNEVINQVAEAYLTYQQQQLREQGRQQWHIEPDKYRDELQKVKAYIATHNVYGVDLNPTAIELGKLSLWLNVIHKDMETPFFSNRLAVGNAVIGAWLRVYHKDQIAGITARKGGKNILLQKAWWEEAPERVHFAHNRPQRKPTDIYHFLLPDRQMLAVRTISEQKAKHPDEERAMRQVIADWTKPITAEDLLRLQKLSKKIDYLLREYYEFQMSIENLTQNKYELFGVSRSTTSLLDTRNFVDSYHEKEQLNDTRYRHNNAYYRLKMVMDYWCSLWFWEYDDTASLPMRDDYWADIDAMLDVSDNKISGTKTVVNTSQDFRPQGELMLDFEASKDQQLTIGEEVHVNPYLETTEAESQIIQKTKQEILQDTQGGNRLIDDSFRFRIVVRLAERYHFFHPMLEFLEVFWLRDGFDIICGNPPWIKLEFDEQGILSDKYPEVAIRKMSAPQVRTMREQMFRDIPQTETIYRAEEMDVYCSSQFMSAGVNYPLLVGQANNLYKCVLENALELVSEQGYIGLLTPESVYDDPNGQPLRRELYKHLCYHFQYQNELRLFAEVHHHTVYGGQLLRGRTSSPPRFASINNLFHPATVDACFAHDGHGTCGGLKDENGKWNTAPHKDRIVEYSEEELQTLSNAFEDGADWETVKLTSIHVKEIINVLGRFANFPTHVSDYSDVIVSEGLHETIAVEKGQMKRNTQYPNFANREMIYSGPHFFVANPVYKTPREQCILNSDYDTIDLTTIDSNYLARTNYIPTVSIEQFDTIIKGFPIGQDIDGKEIYDKWIDYYRIGFRRMIGSTSERSLSGAILPAKTSHMGGVTSVTFKSQEKLIEFGSLCFSLPMDFYVKTLGISDVRANRVNKFPLGIPDKYKPALYSRTLMLNCLTEHYRELWEGCWQEAYTKQTWSREDNRLKPFDMLTKTWSWNIPLRNYFERRQALVEIDVLAAMALGLSLEDLEMIYTIQFPVLQQNENDTWYDAEGKIVFTCSKGLTGVGLDRPVWNQIKGEISEDGLTAQGVAPTYEHVITKSELYQGKHQTFIAPYTRCDRIADYRRAWAHFEKELNE